jgi:Na+/H+-dicarboxylate symporter
MKTTLPQSPVFRILIAAALGMGVGLTLGPRAAPLGDLGKVLIQFVKLLAVPLLFLSVVDAFLHTELSWKSARRMLGVSGLNTAFALLIGLSVSHWLKPGAGFALVGSPSNGEVVGEVGGKSLSFSAVISGLIPTSVGQPFVENAMLPLLVLAVMLGAALKRQLRLQQLEGDASSSEVISKLVRTGLGASRVAITWVVAWVPLAVFGVLAKTVGEAGFAPLLRLPLYLVSAFVGLGLQVFVIYSIWIRFVAKRPLREFWSATREPVAFALGASSSLATLPVTLRALDHLGVSPASARLSACVGTNFNNDGILLYEAMAVLFVAQAYGMDLSLGVQLVACLACVVAGFGISGIPDAGLVSLSIVLVTVGLPTELLPLLLSVDWILSRARAMTNVVADIMGGVVLDALNGSEDRPEKQSPLAGTP